MSLLEVEGLRVRLPGASGLITIVDGVDYRVEQGEVFGVAGVSGSGKTMSMLALLGVLPDGTAFSTSTILDSTGRMPFLARIYRRQGTLDGQVNVAATGEVDPILGTTTHWQKPVMTRDRRFPAGFLRRSLRRWAVEMRVDGNAVPKLPAEELHQGDQRAGDAGKRDPHLAKGAGDAG